MSNWWIGHWRERESSSTRCIMAGLTTGLQVSSQSIQISCDFPFETSLALYCVSFPSVPNLYLKSQIERTMLVSWGRGTRSHVPFLIWASNSSCMTAVQFGSSKALRREIGRGEWISVWRERGCLAFDIPLLLRVCMLWRIVDCGEGAATERVGIGAGSRGGGCSVLVYGGIFNCGGSGWCMMGAFGGGVYVSLVRVSWIFVKKRKENSSKITWWEMIILRERRSRHQ